MRLKIAIPEPHVSAPVLNAGLEAVTRLNEQMIAAGEIPGVDRFLRYGVVWKPEPPGDEHFDSGDRMLKRGWGDCDDWAPLAAASLRQSGEDPGATAVVKRSGPKRWHAVVQRSDGTIDDPSRRAGMRPGISPGVFGAAWPLMAPAQRNAVLGSYIIRPQLAVRPFYGQFQARADLPWQWKAHLRHDKPTAEDIAMTALHTAPVAATALTGAIDDVCQLAACAGFANDDHIQRLCAIADACEGASFDELSAVYGDDHAEAAAQVVGSLFGKIARGIKKVAKKAVMPLARGAASFVPGGSMALSALESGAKMLRGKKRPGAPQSMPLPPRAPGGFPAPGRGGPVSHEPAGAGRPIIVHFH